MGYFIENLKDIAKVTEPARISLSDNPNFVIFESTTTENTLAQIKLNVTGNGYFSSPPEIPDYKNFSAFKIIETKTGAEHSFRGTSVLSEAEEDGIFYLGPLGENGPEWSREQTASSLKEALSENSFIDERYDIQLIPSIGSNPGTLKQGHLIKLISKGFGNEYDFSFEFENKYLTEIAFFKITEDSTGTTSNDSISEGYSPVEIHLELYKDTGIFPGMDDIPNDKNMGSYTTTLTKSYVNSPLWFNANILESKDYSLNFLNKENKWFDTGTVRDFRFIAKRYISSQNYEDTSFYYSNVLYAITGYKRTLEQNDLSEYVYNASENITVKPLTTQPELFHVKGQAQYFNFILADPDHNNPLSGELGITYKIYSQSARFLGEKVSHNRLKSDFHIVNSIRLDIDGTISEYENAGMVEAYLSRSDGDAFMTVSEPLKFKILPECLYKVNDFAFLNSLGGWSSFNFPGTETTDFKATKNTIYKTHTPYKDTHSEIEAVYNKEVEEQFTVQTMPVTRDVAEWLKELSASKAVYELSTGRYVIVDELNIKPNSKDDLFRLDMKYHYSDTFK